MIELGDWVLFKSLFLVFPQGVLPVLVSQLRENRKQEQQLPLLSSWCGPSCPHSIYLSFCDFVSVYWMPSTRLVSSLHLN